MKDFFLALIIVIFTGFPLIIAADETTGPYISLGYNWFNFDKARELENEKDLYFTGGYQSSEHLGFEVKYTDFGGKYYNFSSIYRYQPRNQSSFFWKAGLGKYSSMRTGKSNMNVGAGYSANLDNNFSLEFGIDSVYQFNDDHLDWVPYIGFNYFFAESNKKPQSVVKDIKPLEKDSDGDGVFDSNDQCPNSKAGVSVDARGCELDGDNDGINDSLDTCLATPFGAKVDSNGCRVILTEDVSIKLNVQFANNSNQVTEEYGSDIKRIADFMREYPDVNVVIEGHTDSRGAASYNQQLSQKRANAVMTYLISQFNIEQSRVSAIGKGEASPIANNQTSDGRAANRRVQAEIKARKSLPQ